MSQNTSSLGYMLGMALPPSTGDSDLALTVSELSLFLVAISPMRTDLVLIPQSPRGPANTLPPPLVMLYWGDWGLEKGTAFFQARELSSGNTGTKTLIS